jgi:dethiobiotin synthetase
LQAETGTQESLKELNCYRFSRALAPLAAARSEDVKIDLDAIVRQYRRLTERFRPVVVEGAGGLLVPVGFDWSMRDLIVALDLPIVVVGRTGLGGINHALLTLEALRHAKRHIAALVLNESKPVEDEDERAQQETTIALLHEWADVAVIGPLRYCPALSEDWSGTIEVLARSEPIRQLADRLCAIPS